MKKTLLILLTSTMFTVNAFSQDRTAKPKAEFKSETISQLTSATGWMLNPDEEWVSLKNTIPVSIATQFNTLLDYEEKGLGTDNFKYYKLKELTYKDSTYYALIKQYRDGYYKYKSIEEGWSNSTSYTAYIFAKSELNKLDSIKDEQVNLIKINLIDQVRIKYKIEAKAFDLITTKIDWDKPEAKTEKLILHIAPYKEKGIVQFQIYSTFSEYNFISGIIKEHKIKGEESSSSKEIYMTDDLFKYCYYETDYSDFNNFLKINNK
jgi:hypothetical protein